MSVCLSSFSLTRGDMDWSVVAVFPGNTHLLLEHGLLDERYVFHRHRCHKATKFGVFVNEDHSKLFALYKLDT